MKPTGIFSAHFAAGVLTTCLVGASALYGLESWKKFSSTGSTQIVDPSANVATPRVARMALSPIDFVVDVAPEIASSPQSVFESELTVDGQIEMLSAEYHASKNEATRQSLREQLSILKNNAQ